MRFPQIPLPNPLVQVGIKALGAIRAQSVAKVSFGAVPDVHLDLVPVAFVVTDLFT
jgi:hypothetical protein